MLSEPATPAIPAGDRPAPTTTGTGTKTTTRPERTTPTVDPLDFATELRAELRKLPATDRAAAVRALEAVLTDPALRAAAAVLHAGAAKGKAIPRDRWTTALATVKTSLGETLAG